MGQPPADRVFASCRSVCVMCSDADVISGWRITPIQEPTDGAAFEFQDLSRIQLQPIPIVQIDCWDPETQQFIVP